MKMYDESKKALFPFSNPVLRKQAMGRWFSSNPRAAMNYAGNKRFLSMLHKILRDVLSWGGGFERGVVKKLTLSAKEDLSSLIKLCTKSMELNIWTTSSSCPRRLYQEWKLIS